MSLIPENLAHWKSLCTLHHSFVHIIVLVLAQVRRIYFQLVLFTLSEGELSERFFALGKPFEKLVFLRRLLDMGDPTEFLRESNLFYLFDLIPQVMGSEKIRFYILGVWIYRVEHERKKEEGKQIYYIEKVVKINKWFVLEGRKIKLRDCFCY